MPQSLNIKIRGLYTFPNDFSSVPEGALAVADNIVVDRDSIAEPRRGLNYLSSAAGRADFIDASGRAIKKFFYQDTIIAQVKTGAGVYSLVYFNTTDGWHALAAAFNPPLSTVKTRSNQAKGNLYLTTSYGVARVDAYNGSVAPAGVPQALDIQSVKASASGAWLIDGNSVTYRVAWGYKDLNNNLLIGAPSGALIVTNDATLSGYSGAAKAIEVTIPIPFGITPSYFLQLYRSPQVTGTPNDELKQVFEIFPESTDITDGVITFTDITTEALNRGANLYTNVSQDGASFANVHPPKALDIASYRDCMFYGNIREQQSFILTVLDVIPLGDTDGDTLTIGATTYTVITNDDPPYVITDPPFIIVITNQLDSINRRETAINIVRSINFFQDEYYATYISGVDDIPGKILIQSYDVGDAPFYLTSSMSWPWLPPLPVSGTLISSDDSYAPHGVAYSKPFQPESVPLPYRLPIGSKDSAILRILPLRDSLFILKEDGVWRIYGTDPSNFQVALLDSTANCIAPDTAVIMNNQIFALTTQGVVTISETGVTIMSRPIEGDLLDLLAINPTVLVNHAFSVAYESQRAFYLFLPTLATDTGPTQYYRYNTITNNWTRGTLAKSCGGVNPFDDKLYLGDPDNKWLDQERKSLTSWDYADYVNTFAISATSGAVVTIASASTLLPGQTIYQAPNYAVKTCSTTTDVAFATGIFTKNGHGFVTGLKVGLSINSGALPAGLSATDYWIINLGANTFKLATTYALAIAGTTAVFTDNGTTAKVLTFTPNSTPIWGEILTVGATEVTMAYPTQFIYAAADVSDPIATQIKWVPCTFANPGINKQVRETTIMFLSDFYGAAEVSFETDISPQVEIEDVIGLMAAPFGYFPWGTAPWGGYAPRRKPLRVGVPRIHQRCSFIVVGFEHAHCFSPWAIQGISLIGNNISEKVWMEGSTV